jgi:acyl-coenzyme A synthetase/AMP-(fatty) acid ligase
VTQAGIGGIAAFVSGKGLDATALRSGVRARLQDHAVPQTIQVLSELPHNANGKVDRQALLQLLSA